MKGPASRSPLGCYCELGVELSYSTSTVIFALATLHPMFEI